MLLAGSCLDAASLGLWREWRCQPWGELSLQPACCRGASARPLVLAPMMNRRRHLAECWAGWGASSAVLHSYHRSREVARWLPTAASAHSPWRQSLISSFVQFPLPYPHPSISAFLLTSLAPCSRHLSLDLFIFIPTSSYLPPLSAPQKALGRQKVWVW